MPGPQAASTGDEDRCTSQWGTVIGDIRVNCLDTVVDGGIGVKDGRGVPWFVDVGVGEGAMLPVHARIMMSMIRGSMNVVIRRDCRGTYFFEYESVV